MKKAKTTKKALLLSVLSTLICCAMLAGSTFAWFTDSATTSVNQIVAGNLDIELEVKTADGFKNVTEVNDLFAVDAWEPGVVAYETFQAVNEGNLALKYNMYLSFANANFVKGTDYSLADVIKIAVLDGELAADATRDSLINAVQDKLTSLNNATQVADGKLLPKDQTGDKKVYTVVAYWEPTNNDNNYNLNNGKETSDDDNALHIDFSVTLSATQVPYEKDSFTDNYDANIPLGGLEAMETTINQGAKDSNAAIVNAIKALAKENGTDLTDKDITKIVYFDDELQENVAGELAITLHFEQDSLDYVDATYAAVKALIGAAVNAQAGNIYSIQIENQPVHVLNGKSTVVDSEGQWVEDDLKAIVRAISNAGGLSGALEAAQANGLAVEIIDMDGNAQTYRMNFDLKW